MRQNLNFKEEKDKSNLKKVVIGIIVVFLILSGSISVAKSDIHRVKNKIINLHEYSGM
ncbi:MAG: hypothetical protein RR745_05925 [Bacilli bacterium]